MGKKINILLNQKPDELMFVFNLDFDENNNKYK